jgi:GDP-D-mannose dehydratase
LKEDKLLSDSSDSIISDYYASTSLFNQTRSAYYDNNSNNKINKIANFYMKSPYAAANVFSLHFPHYNETLKLSNNR